MNRLALATLALAATMSTPALAGTTLIDVGALPSRTVHGAAELTPLAVSPAGAPVVMLLSLEAGAVVPPHATDVGLRLLTVLSGAMSWGDGSEIVEADERVYGPGAVLTLPSGLDHWLAARDGPVVLQLIVLDGAAPVAAMREQMP